MSDRKQKLVLDIDAMTDRFYSDVCLLGIMASIKDYRFCWQINHLTSRNFKVNTDLELTLRRKGREYFFPVYEYHESIKNLTHYLYNNQNDGEYLLPELKHIDFLWLLKGDGLTDETKEETIQLIKGLDSVQLVIELENEKIKNKEYLLF